MTSQIRSRIYHFTTTDNILQLLLHSNLILKIQPYRWVFNTI